MVSYTNETKIKDIPDPSFDIEIKELLKSAILDFGSDMKKELFEHTGKRLVYILKNSKYKNFILGEVKYIFDTMIEHAKGKLSVAVILQLFQKYFDEKIEKQRQSIEEYEQSIDKNFINCGELPLGKAIIHKMQLAEDFKKENGRKMTDEEWVAIPLKEIARKIKSSEIAFHFKTDKQTKHIWDE